MAGGDSFKADFLRHAYFHDDSLSAPNGEPMPYENVKHWFAEQCRQADADAIATAERNLRSRLEKLRVNLPGAPQIAPAVDYRVERENFSRIKRLGEFRNSIIKLRGGVWQCDVCNMDVKAMIEGAHVHQVFENGDFHPSNGLLLCANHHRMWDRALFAVDPTDGAIVQRALKKAALGVTRAKIPQESFALVDKQRLSQRWDAWARRFKAKSPNQSASGRAAPVL